MRFNREYPDDLKSFLLQDIEVYEDVTIRFSFSLYYSHWGHVCRISGLHKDITKTAIIDNNFNLLYGDMPLKWVEKAVERLKHLLNYTDIVCTDNK